MRDGQVQALPGQTPHSAQLPGRLQRQGVRLNLQQRIRLQRLAAWPTQTDQVGPHLLERPVGPAASSPPGDGRQESPRLPA